MDNEDTLEGEEFLEDEVATSNANGRKNDVGETNCDINRLPKVVNSNKRKLSRKGKTRSNSQLEDGRRSIKRKCGRDGIYDDSMSDDELIGIIFIFF